MRLWIWAASTLVSGVLVALSDQYAEFGKGPARFIMTLPERAAWKLIKDDVEARKFIDEFWERRDPAYRVQFDQNVTFADEAIVTHRMKRGSLTDMGRVLVIMGAPTRQERYQVPPKLPLDAYPPLRRTNEQGVPMPRDESESDRRAMRGVDTICWSYQAKRKGFNLEPSVPPICFHDPDRNGEWVLKFNKELESLFEDVNRSRLVFDDPEAKQADSKE